MRAIVVEPDGFRDYVLARSPALLRTAWLLTGDAAAAEDLLQVALAAVWPRWERIRHEAPDAYVRTTMVRANARRLRRRWHGETPVAEVRDGEVTADRQQEVAEQLRLAAALQQLPTRQRQAVVLRHAEDLPVEVVAELMGCSAGTVKSQCAKGLQKLRVVLQVLDPEEVEMP